MADRINTTVEGEEAEIGPIVIASHLLIDAFRAGLLPTGPLEDPRTHAAALIMSELTRRTGRPVPLDAMTLAGFGRCAIRRHQTALARIDPTLATIIMRR